VRVREMSWRIEKGRFEFFIRCYLRMLGISRACKLQVTKIARLLPMERGMIDFPGYEKWRNCGPIF
jgi:hypothetical protein